MQSPYLAQAVQEISRQGRLAARGILDGWAPAWHPARRRRSPRPSRAQARHGRVRPEAAPASARGVQIAAPQGWRGAARPSPRGGAGERPASRQPRLGRRRRRGAGGGYASPTAQRAGAGQTPANAHQPHTVGRARAAAPPPQPARGRSGARPHGVRPLAGLALRRGRVPPSNGGGQLDRAGLARPWPPHYPGQPRRGWTGRAAASRRPGRAGVRPAGRRGRVGRALPQGARTGAPLPPPSGGGHPQHASAGRSTRLRGRAAAQAAERGQTRPSIGGRAETSDRQPHRVRGLPERTTAHAQPSARACGEEPWPETVRRRIRAAARWRPRRRSAPGRGRSGGRWRPAGAAGECLSRNRPRGARHLRPPAAAVCRAVDAITARASARAVVLYRGRPAACR